MKTCFKCLKLKDIKEFYAHPGTSDGHLNKCKVCARKDGREAFKVCDRDARNAKRKLLTPLYARKQKDSHYKRVCGVGLDWVEAKILEQKGLCAVCGKGGELVLDHDHATSKPRAMLHRTCNSALGLLREDLDIAIGLAKYIQEHKGVI